MKRFAKNIYSIFLTSALIVTSLAAAVAVAAAPTDESRVALVYPPWWRAVRAVSAAASAGEVLDLGGLPFVVIVHRKTATSHEAWPPAGVLFVMGADPRSLCSAATLESKL